MARREGVEQRDTAGIPATAELDAFFDPARVHSEQAAQRQQKLVRLALRLAFLSFIPIAGIVPGCLAILFAHEARVMFAVVGVDPADERRTRRVRTIGCVMVAVWFVAIIVLICVAAIEAR